MIHCIQVRSLCIVYEWHLRCIGHKMNNINTLWIIINHSNLFVSKEDGIFRVHSHFRLIYHLCIVSFATFMITMLMEFRIVYCIGLDVILYRVISFVNLDPQRFPRLTKNRKCEHSNGLECWLYSSFIGQCLKITLFFYWFAFYCIFFHNINTWLWKFWSFIVQTSEWALSTSHVKVDCLPTKQCVILHGDSIYDVHLMKRHLLNQNAYWFIYNIHKSNVSQVVALHSRQFVGKCMVNIWMSMICIF